jgi:tetratricopeptide (TPR) repeat protein
VAQGAADRAEASGRTGLAAIALNALAHIHLLRGKFGQSRTELSRMLSYTERDGRVGAIIFGRMHRAFAAFWAGDWAAARNDIEQAVGLEWTIEESYLRSYVAVVQGILEIHVGQTAEGRAHLEQAAAHGKKEVVWQAQALLAELNLLSDHPDVARAALEPLVELQEPTGKDIIFVAPRLAWAYLALGNVTAATDLLERFLAMARAGEALLGVCEALRVRALVAIHQANWDEAARSLDEAWSLTGDPPSPFAQLKLHFAYGQSHAARGEPGPARERFEAALAIGARLGEALYRPPIERALAALGA